MELVGRNSTKPLRRTSFRQIMGSCSPPAASPSDSSTYVPIRVVSRAELFGRKFHKIPAGLIRA